ncbi:MAG: RsmD family RNA methyltransferase [bacterium]|jgi:16S rRNA (guanine966-N2)-methyltransferase|nr:RsmD family RNA methyltransferase [bacterium]
MRVVAGRWRGRRLLPPPGDAIRPTADRVKEALFSILGARVAGAVFVDLCCGTGALGIEALSRGAGRAIFVDEAKTSLTLAGANLARCGATEGSFSLERCEALAWLDRWSPADGSPWLLVADPPYRTPLGAHIMERLLARPTWPGCRALAVEQGSENLAPLPADEAWELRRYGQATLALWLAPET